MNRRILVPVLVAVTLVAGCATKTRGSAEPAPATGESSSSAAGGGSAPKVSSPLNDSGVRSDACNALSPAEQDQLGYGTGKPRQGPAGPSCTFLQADDPSNQLDITAVTANQNGLGDIYDAKANDGYFEPTEVSGYPAVYAAGYTDDRKNGECGMFVGITDQLTMNLVAQYGHEPGKSQVCQVVEKAAEAMIATLKGS